MDIFYCFILWSFCFGTLLSQTPIYECGDEDAGLDRFILRISETSPQGTPLAIFSHTKGSLRWTVSINETDDQKLGTFFTTEPMENNTILLKLAKTPDLELLQVQQMLRPESLDLITMSVRCQSPEGTTQSKEFDLSIEPKNEFHPVFNKSPYKTEVLENTAVGTVIFNLKEKTMDMDFGNTELTFGIEPYTISEFDGQRYVTIGDPQSGKIVLSELLDFEAFLQRRRNYFLINVTVADDGGLKSVTSINVTVLDTNDQGIEFEYPSCRTPCQSANYTVETNESYTGIFDVKPRSVFARDLDTLNARIKYALNTAGDSQYFRIDETTGQLYKISPLVNDTYGYIINLQVYAAEVDNDSHHLLTNVTVYIRERKPPSNFLLNIEGLRKDQCISYGITRAIE